MFFLQKFEKYMTFWKNIKCVCLSVGRRPTARCRCSVGRQPAVGHWLDDSGPVTSTAHRQRAVGILFTDGVFFSFSVFFFLFSLLFSFFCFLYFFSSFNKINNVFRHILVLFYFIFHFSFYLLYFVLNT